MTDLDKLIEAVEAGAFDARKYPLMQLPRMEIDTLDRIHASYNGSVDAAMALHEALIPEWDACVSLSGHVWLYIPNRGAPPIKERSEINASKPARAWLLAILKAYRAKQND